MTEIFVGAFNKKNDKSFYRFLANLILKKIQSTFDYRYVFASKMLIQDARYGKNAF